MMNLTVQLKVLQESIEYYEKLVLTLEEQMEELWAEKESLFDIWKGPHADSCNEKLCAVINGGIGALASENTVSLNKVKERAEQIRDLLKEAQNRFCIEKACCEEDFCDALDSEGLYITSRGSSQMFQTELYIDYDAVSTLCSAICDLVNGSCALTGDIRSQKGSWDNLVTTFGNALEQDSYHPRNSDEAVNTILEKENRRLNNFYTALYCYHNNLKAEEELLMEEFGKAAEQSAKGITREIYEVYVTGEINIQRVWYLGQKSPEELTPSEISEIYRMLQYVMDRPESQADTDMTLLTPQSVGRMQVLGDPKDTALYNLFRNYSAALNTTYMNDLSKDGQKEQVSVYFKKETLKRLLSGTEAQNYDALNRLMEDNPSGLTAGDLEAVTIMFDRLVPGAGSEGMDRANMFLAHCYISGEGNPVGALDAVRSPVFERWALYYLNKNQTTAEDFAILNGDGDRNAVHAKFLKQALLNIAMSSAAMKVQVQGGFYPNGSENWEKNRGIFQVGSLNTGRNGDYQLTFYQSYKESGACIEIEYYEYRHSSGMGTMFDDAMRAKLREYKKDFPDYAMNSGKKFVSGMVVGKVVKGSKEIAVLVAGTPVGWVVDGAVEAAKFGTGWNKQTKENTEIEMALAKYQDGLEMEAYQQSGQVMYVNGIRIINNGYVDQDRQEELIGGFNKQVLLVKLNKNYNEFFPQDCDAATRTAIENGLRDPSSNEYKQAFVKWYHEAKGDSMHGFGKDYKQEEEN